MSLPRRPRHTTHARPFYVSLFSRARHSIRRSPLWKASSGIIAAALAIGMVAVGVALPASAHTPNVSATCAVLTVNLQSYSTEQYNAKPNTVKVTLNTTVVETASFGASFSGSYNFPSSASGQKYSVAVTAYDDPTGSKGWTKTFTGTNGSGCVAADASAAVSTTAASCSAAEALVLGDHINSVWGAATRTTNSDGTVGYSVVATADSGHSFTSGSGVSSDGKTKTFTGTLAKKLTTNCTAPTCIPASSVSYTYLPKSNSGTITVNDVTGSTHALCKGFWVTATSWTYRGHSMWPQDIDVIQRLAKITKPGNYDYVAAVGCGQGDIYASYDAQPDPFTQPVVTSHPVLTASNTPFPENFLHSMGFTGPNPTYVNASIDCFVAKDASATVSVTPATCTAPAQLNWGAIANAKFSGTANGTTGPVAKYTVTATANTDHLFGTATGVSSDHKTQAFAGVLAGAIGYQSTDSSLPCYIPVDAVANVSVTPATCTTAAVLNWGSISNAAFSGTANGTTGPVAKYTVTATANTNHLFSAGGSGVASNQKTQAFTGALAGAIGYQSTDSYAPCYIPKDASAAVSVTPATCTAPAVLNWGSVANAAFSGTANGTTGPLAKYTVTATASAGHLFGTANGVSSDFTTQVFTGALAGATGYQSNDSSLPCYIPVDAVANVTVTPATCTAPAELKWGSISNAAFSGTANGTQGALAKYTVTATANTNHLFTAGGSGVSSDQKTQVFTGALAGAIGFQSADSTAPCYLAVDAAAVVTVTPPTCSAPAMLNWGSIANAKFSGTADGTTGLLANYTVTATANTNHLFTAGGSGVSSDQKTQVFTGALADATGYQTTDPTAPCYKVLYGDPVVSPETCFDGAPTTGSIWVDLKPQLKYTITGPGGLVIDPVVAATNPLHAGTYVVSVEALPGYTLGGVSSWPHEVVASAGDCKLTTLADLKTAATATNPVCSPSGSPTGGSITVGHVVDATGVSDFFNVGVTYFIDGVKVTSQTTAKAAGTYHVTATLDDPADTLVGPDSWFLTIGAAAQACGQLTTLPFTGVSGNPIGILLIALLLLLAGTGVYTGSRLKPRSKN